MADMIDRCGVVRATRNLTPRIRLIEIEPEGSFVPPSSGSHIDFSIKIGERPDFRSYSVVGPCADGVYRIAVKLLEASRGGSAFMWSLAPGARIAHSAPGNHFGLALGRPEYLLIAGGIGVTPIFSHALALAHAGARFRLLYACRSRGDLALADELRCEIGERLDIRLSDEGRRIDIAAEIAALDPRGEFYVCGPIGMLEAAKRAWAASGRPLDLLRFETFGASGQYPPVPFTVRIPRLNREIRVAANQTMLEALEEEGIEMIFDCKRGECGLCALPILAVDGVVDHRDVFFSEAEKAAERQALHLRLARLRPNDLCRHGRSVRQASGRLRPWKRGYVAALLGHPLDDRFLAHRARDEGCARRDVSWREDGKALLSSAFPHPGQRVQPGEHAAVRVRPERGDDPQLMPPGNGVKLRHQPFAGLGQHERVAAAVIRRRRPTHQLAHFQLVDHGDEIRPLDAERFADLALLQARIAFDDRQDRVLPGPDVEIFEGGKEVAEHGDLRAPERVAEAAVQRPVVDRDAFGRRRLFFDRKGLRSPWRRRAHRSSSMILTRNHSYDQ